MNQKKYIEDAKASKFGLWKLNFGLFKMIPFNKPHGIKIKTLKNNSIETFIPHKRKNLNHIKGIHACGLATCAEFASGFLLLSRLDMKKYRIIMETIEMKYHYQAKTDVTAKFSFSEEWLNDKIITPLIKNEAIFIECIIELYDTKNNHIATGKTNWQIKDWDKVKTKV